MDYVRKAEARLTQIYARAPRLPRAATEWLGKNLWWIVLVYAILGVFGVLSNIHVLTGISTRNSLESIYLAGGNELLTASAVFSLVVSIVVTALYFAAVGPLKEGKKTGWDIILATLLLSVVFSVVSLVLSFVLYGGTIAIIAVVIAFLIGLVLTAVLLYFLFSVRDQFATRASRAKKANVTVKKTSKK